MSEVPFLQRRLINVVGERTARALDAGFGMATVDDLLRHYPRRYQVKGQLTALAELEVGAYVTVIARVVSASTRPMRARKGSITEVVVTDGTEDLALTFFNQPRWSTGRLKPGRTGMFAGQVGVFKGVRQLTQPTMDLLPDGVDDDPLASALFAGSVIPIYPATAAVTSATIARALDVVLAHLPDDLADPLPDAVRAAHRLIGLAKAFRAIHRPAEMGEVDPARERLLYEEAFVLQTLIAQRRAAVRALHATRRIPEQSPLLDAFDASLPFALTAGQRSVGEQIDEDMARGYPMHRLLQGDVASGKTVVALRAMLRVVDAGGQAALLAPTEVLAAQHHASITQLLGPLGRRGQLDGAEIGTRVALLTGSQRTDRRRRELLDVVTGDAGIVVGTHALLQEHVDFGDLALIVVDEQHRFGVEQRAALAAKSRDDIRPHVLVMTATPIPRSAAMTVFGDVDLSTLTELPAGRAPITTHVVETTKPAHVARIWDRVREEVEAGHRVFVVAPRIDEPDPVPGELAPGDAVILSGVDTLATALAAGELAGVRVGVLHGRLPADVKADAMRRFADLSAPDGIDVLVATTVIEVGVDVPSATMMVVVDADRFGISQLHQLRGRIGRGGLPGLCLLVTSAEVGSPTRERIEAVAATTDGFVLAERDLELRREGDVLGSAQSGGRSSLRLLRVQRDAAIIEEARDEALAFVDGDPTLATQPGLATAVDLLVGRESSTFLDKA